MLSTAEVLETLRRCSYLNDSQAKNLQAPSVRAALRLFQSDRYLVVDGIYGPQSDSALTSLHEILQNAPSEFTSFRRFRITHYWIAEQNVGGDVPVLSPMGSELARVSPKFFANMALEGTGKLLNGKLLNVSSKWVPVKNPPDYSPVLEVAKSYKWVPDKVAYAGIRLGSDGRVASVMSFDVVPPAKIGDGYGSAQGMPLRAWRSCASDIGAYSTSEPKYRKRGGLVPVGTRLYCLDLVGREMKGLAGKHDGWLVAHDTGGAISGAHLDLFTGNHDFLVQSQAYKPLPKICLVSGSTPTGEFLDTRIPYGYTRGL